MTKWSRTNLQMKYGNLAAYHIPAAHFPDDAGAADNVNVFRLVDNAYFGANLPYRPDCYFGYPDGRNKPMNFQSVTQQLTGSAPEAACGDDGTSKP